MSDELKEVKLEKGVSTKKLKKKGSAPKAEVKMKPKSLEYRENQHEDPDILRRMRIR